jgi:L-ascorbate metabolism protein UlaG (beta-lactamase superfamily)
VTQPSLTWLGHSTVQLDLGGARFLTDPVLRSRIVHLLRRGPRPAPPPDVDAVLVSHLHYDHLDLPSLRMLEPKPRAICAPGAGAFLSRAGFSEIVELLPGESVQVAGARVEATRAEHGGRRHPRGPRAPALGFVVRGERSVYFAGDTDLFDEMAELGPVDVALLPVAGYSPKLGPGHLDERRAAEAAGLVQARVAVPIHWGTFRAFSQRGGAWFTGPGDGFAACAAELAPDVDVRVLSPGESLDL